MPFTKEFLNEVKYVTDPVPAENIAEYTEDNDPKTVEFINKYLAENDNVADNVKEFLTGIADGSIKTRPYVDY